MIVELAVQQHYTLMIIQRSMQTHTPRIQQAGRQRPTATSLPSRQTEDQPQHGNKPDSDWADTSYRTHRLP